MIASIGAYVFALFLATCIDGSPLMEHTFHGWWTHDKEWVESQVIQSYSR